MASGSTSSKPNTWSTCFCNHVSSWVVVPVSSTSANVKVDLAKSNTHSPASLDRNSPCSFSNFKAFHCLGLCEAVKINPPSASNPGTANSTVGVVLSPKSITSMPCAFKVPHTMSLTQGPLIRASRPTTTTGLRSEVGCF